MNLKKIINANVDSTLKHLGRCIIALSLLPYTIFHLPSICFSFDFSVEMAPHTHLAELISQMLKRKAKEGHGSGSSSSTNSLTPNFAEVKVLFPKCKGPILCLQLARMWLRLRTPQILAAIRVDLLSLMIFLLPSLWQGVHDSHL